VSGQPCRKRAARTIPAGAGQLERLRRGPAVRHSLWPDLDFLLNDTTYLALVEVDLAAVDRDLLGPTPELVTYLVGDDGCRDTGCHRHDERYAAGMSTPRDSMAPS
jgi:hypothetical protein